MTFTIKKFTNAERGAFTLEWTAIAAGMVGMALAFAVLTSG